MLCLWMMHYAEALIVLNFTPISAADLLGWAWPRHLVIILPPAKQTLATSPICEVLSGLPGCAGLCDSRTFLSLGQGVQDENRGVLSASSNVPGFWILQASLHVRSFHHSWWASLLALKPLQKQGEENLLWVCWRLCDNSYSFDFCTGLPHCSPLWVSPDSRAGSSTHQIQVLSFQSFPTQFWDFCFTEWTRMMLPGVRFPGDNRHWEWVL